MSNAEQEPVAFKCGDATVYIKPPVYGTPPPQRKEPEQEPVGKFAKFTDGIWREVTDGSAGVPLYTTPPQRTWFDLNAEDCKHLYLASQDKADAILKTAAKLKDKNL